MSFLPEPRFAAVRPSRVGVLLVNLGTPDEPTAPALRRYLGQFLSDPRVVELPKLLWAPILHGIILRIRPAKSAAKYASIWTEQGSPLRAWTERQTTLLEGFLGERGHQLLVRHAMRYGQPSIASQLSDMKAQGVDKVLVVPLYPQYCGATTASVMDDVHAWMNQTRFIPEVRHINDFHLDEGYIEALASQVRAHWMTNGHPDKVLMSFHGMPARTAQLGDPYQNQCHATADMLALRLGLKKDGYVVTFQSRFGKAKWLEPYTEPTLRQLGKQGVGRVDVLCPGFVSDCIETLEEIAMEGKEAFLSSGGQSFNYIACLNDRLEWIRALTGIVENHLQGWSTRAGQEAASVRPI